MSCGSFIIFEEVVTPSGSAPITRRDVPRPVFTQRWICGMTERARCLLIVVRTREDPKCPSTEGWSLTLGTSSLQTCSWRPVPCRGLRDRQSGAHTFTCGITAMMKVFTSRERAGDRPSGQSQETSLQPGGRVLAATPSLPEPAVRCIAVSPLRAGPDGDQKSRP